MLAAGGRIVAVPLAAGQRRHDIGSPEGYCSAFLEYGLTDSRLGPALRDRARKAIGEWRSRLAATVREAIDAGEIGAVDHDAFAATAIATVEGAIMLAGLYKAASYLHHAADHLAAHLDALRARRPG